MQNYAVESMKTAALNSQSGKTAALQFPVPRLSLASASALLPPSSPTGTMRHVAGTPQDKPRLTHHAPVNCLLLPAGSALGAIADIMSVQAVNPTGSEPLIVLTLDVVHEPKLVSELTDHPHQTLDENAHYHFFTPADVTVDAAAFLNTLKASAAQGIAGKQHACRVGLLQHVSGYATLSAVGAACYWQSTCANCTPQLHSSAGHDPLISTGCIKRTTWDPEVFDLLFCNAHKVIDASLLHTQRSMFSQKKPLGQPHAVAG